MNPILFPAPLKIRATYIKIVENKQNVHYLWCHDFLNFDDIFKNDRVRGGLQSVKIKKPPGMMQEGAREDRGRGGFMVILVCPI